MPQGFSTNLKHCKHALERLSHKIFKIDIISHKTKGQKMRLKQIVRDETIFFLQKIITCIVYLKHKSWSSKENQSKVFRYNMDYISKLEL